jgi:uncharacterized protein YjbJ (UPF0337 family)
MNKDVFEGKAKEMRGQVKEWWGKLTDNDLEQAGGNAEQIVGLIQQKYGYTREHAEEEFNRRIEEAKMKVKQSWAALALREWDFQVVCQSQANRNENKRPFMDQAQITHEHTVYVGKEKAGIYWQNVLPGNLVVDGKWEGERFAKAGGGAYLTGLFDTEAAVAKALNASIAAAH